MVDISDWAPPRKGPFAEPPNSDFGQKDEFVNALAFGPDSSCLRLGCEEMSFRRRLALLNGFSRAPLIKPLHQVV